MSSFANVVHPAVSQLIQACSPKTIPLSANAFSPHPLPQELTSLDPARIFPQARDPRATLAGLFLLAGHWDLSHKIAQDIHSREGSYWHAILHRIEPDSWNSGYWFQRVGDHPIYRPLHEQAQALLKDSNTRWHLKAKWEPKLFIEWCDQARGMPGSDQERLADHIQRAEFDLLWNWCLAPASQ